MAYTPLQNGVVEDEIRTLLVMIRSMMAHAHLLLGSIHPK